MDIQELLSLTVKNKASDLHLLVDIPPAFRIDGSLRFATNYQPLKTTDIEEMVFGILTPEHRELLAANKELDFSFSFNNGPEQSGRFRINAYYEKGYLAAAFRLVASRAMTLEELNLPPIIHDFAKLRQGFVLVTGPSGQGKSSTLAAIINEINQNRSCHILTIEDPIEFIYAKGNSIISQREMGIDTHDWSMALKSALREDPDVVLIGEMRDPETIQAAMTLAETGHVVFSTLHTNSAAQSVDRIVDSFSSDKRPQVRLQLAATLKGIVSQRLLPKIGGGRIPAVEVLIGNAAVANNIRDGKTHLIDTILQTSKDSGMITLDESLAALVRGGIVTLDDAKAYCLRENEFLRTLG